MQIKRMGSLAIIVIVIFILFLLVTMINLQDVNAKLEGKGKDDKLEVETSPAREWFRIWGTEGNDVAVDQNDNCYLVGSIANDAFIVKFDANGNEIWNRTWGGAEDDEAYGLVIDSNTNSCYLIGATESFGVSLVDGFIVKYDLNGTQLWNLTWGGPNTDAGVDVTVDSFGNCYAGGLINKSGDLTGDAILLKYDSDGNQLWNRTYGGAELDDTGGIDLDSGNNCYIAGTTSSFGTDHYDLFIVKYNQTGTQLWNRTYDYDAWERCFGMAIDGLNNCYLVGDPGLLKYDSEGNQLWHQTLDILEYPLATAIAIDTENNCYVTGHTWVYDIFRTIYSAFVLKLDSSGNALGHRLIYDDALYWGNGIAVDESNNFYVAGEIRVYAVDAFLFKSSTLYPLQVSGFEWLFFLIGGQLLGLLLLEWKYMKGKK
ncbi:MAG: hypothetical protein HWN66_10660 [Candidatus Helarchaeota archaeon]|nr:hypothetical protein [Candidatus Helarchaeota archaeon]